MINKLIDELKIEAERQFPVKETTNLLANLPNLIKDLEPYLFFTPDKYTRNLIFQSAEFELLALCWLPGHAAPIHGHEGEKCWARVEQGKLRFMSYKDVFTNNALELALTEEVVGEQGYVDGPAYIHAIENTFSEPAISLHLYAKPFHECNVYINNKAERHSLSYDTKFGRKL